MTAMAQALSVALVDFVWQGLLVAFLLWIALYVLKNRSPRIRYGASCLALAAMASLPVITAIWVNRAPAAFASGGGWRIAAPSMGRISGAASGNTLLDWSAWLAHWTLPVWFSGVLLLSLRLVWVSRQIARLRRQAELPSEGVLAAVARLAGQMRLARPVRVLMSAAADSPSVVGWLRPVVLLPAATVLGLTEPQLEAVLAHELAHILRCDYVVNMLQVVVETLLFYHPAVWWVSARIRQERELCCDDLAVACCGDALCYARALTRLERLRGTAPTLSLGSTGGSLAYRIRRIVGEASPGRAPAKLPGILALALGLLSVGLNLPWARGQQADAPSVAETGAYEPGVRVELGGARVIHREPVEYPAAAMEKGIQGTVVLEVTLDAAGMVSDARVLSGPQELRKAALGSVLEWHFAQEAANSMRQVSITFASRVEGAPVGGVDSGVSGGIHGGVTGGIRGGIGVRRKKAEKEEAEIHAERQEEAARRQLLAAEKTLRQSRAQNEEQLAPDIRSLEAQLQKLVKEREALSMNRTLENELEILRQSRARLEEGASTLSESQKFQMEDLKKRLEELRSEAHGVDGRIFAARTVKSITVLGLSGALRDELLSKLPVHVGDTLTEESFKKIAEAVNQFDEHLGLSIIVGRDGQAEIRITAPGADRSETDI